MIWLFVGITLFVALGRVAGEDVAYFALIPASIGMALLIFYIVEGRKGAAGKDVVALVAHPESHGADARSNLTLLRVYAARRASRHNGSTRSDASPRHRCPGARMPFSGPLDERQLIRELIADYCDAVNRRDDVAWGATWDEDGVWSLPFLGIEGIRGRANIVSTWKQAMALFSFAHMMAQAGRIEVDGERAARALLHRRGHGSRGQRRRAATLRSV